MIFIIMEKPDKQIDVKTYIDTSQNNIFIWC